jgi:hypothetical protein
MCGPRRPVELPPSDPTMRDPVALWADLVGHAERLLHLLDERQFEGQPFRAAVPFMLMRSHRLYEAALLLFKAELPEEAAILGRSLFETAMRLRELAAEPGERDHLLVGWLRDSVNQRKGLFETAKSLGLDPDVRAYVLGLDEQRKRLDASTRELAGC